MLYVVSVFDLIFLIDLYKHSLFAFVTVNTLRNRTIHSLKERELKHMTKVMLMMDTRPL